MRYQHTNTSHQATSHNRSSGFSSVAEIAGGMGLRSLQPQQLALDFAPAQVRSHGLRDAHTYPQVARRQGASFRVPASQAWGYPSLELRAGNSWPLMGFDCDVPEKVLEALVSNHWGARSDVCPALPEPRHCQQSQSRRGRGGASGGERQRADEQKKRSRVSQNSTDRRGSPPNCSFIMGKIGGGVSIEVARSTRAARTCTWTPPPASRCSIAAQGPQPQLCRDPHPLPQRPASTSRREVSLGYRVLRPEKGPAPNATCEYLPFPQAKVTEGVSIDDYSTWRAVRFADRDEVG